MLGQGDLVVLRRRDATSDGTAEGAALGNSPRLGRD
jgi:hypothetical protein